MVFHVQYQSIGDYFQTIKVKMFFMGNNLTGIGWLMYFNRFFLISFCGELEAVNTILCEIACIECAERYIGDKKKYPIIMLFNNFLIFWK